MSSDTNTDNGEIQSLIISLCLKSKEIYVRVKDELKATDFTEDYVIIFDCIEKYYLEHSEVDAALLIAEVPKTVSGILIDILDLFAPETLLEDYIISIKESSKKRQLLKMADSVKGHIVSNKVNSSSIINGIQAVLSMLVNKDTKYFKTAQYLTKEFRDKCNLIKKGAYIDRSLSTGYTKLDGFLRGLEPGNLYTLVAQTSIGKSALAINIANNIAKTNKVIFYSLEMTGEKLFDRILSRIAGINAIYLPQKTDMLNEVLKEANKLNLGINDEPALSAEDIYLKTSVIPNVKLIVIDYLHLMKLGKGETQALRVGATTRELKRIAKKLDIPVLLLSQFNRNVSYRSTPEPMLSDIKDSSSIEQDSDVVFFMYQPTEEKSDLIIKIAKNREGAKGSYSIQFEPSIMTFIE